MYFALTTDNVHCSGPNYPEVAGVIKRLKSRRKRKKRKESKVSALWKRNASSSSPQTRRPFANKMAVEARKRDGCSKMLKTMCISNADQSMCNQSLLVNVSFWGAYVYAPNAELRDERCLAEDKSKKAPLEIHLWRSHRFSASISLRFRHPAIFIHRLPRANHFGR